MELRPDTLKVHTGQGEISTEGRGQIIDITPFVSSEVEKSLVQEGTATVFVPGATAGLTTIEYEDGLIDDFHSLWERIAPERLHYAHNARWGDGNGHSHIRASLLGPSIVIPVTKGRLTLGTWQQIILVDFDNRPRKRRFVCQIMGI